MDFHQAEMKCVMDLISRTSNRKQSHNDDFYSYPFLPYPFGSYKKYQIYHETNQNVISRTFPYLFQIIAKNIKKHDSRIVCTLEVLIANRGGKKSWELFWSWNHLQSQCSVFSDKLRKKCDLYSKNIDDYLFLFLLGHEFEIALTLVKRFDGEFSFGSLKHY